MIHGAFSPGRSARISRARSGCAVARRRRFRFETLEHRQLLSAQDASYAISPAWFEQITPAASVPAEEAAIKSDSVKADHSSQWLVQFTSTAVSGLASIHDSRALFDGGPRFELVQGLGRVGQVLIHADGDADSISKWLAANPHVQYFEPNQNLWSIDVVPNDGRLADLWGMNNTGQTGGGNDSDIDAPEAWDLTTGSAGVVVGIIDTGVDYNHPDLAANIWTNPGEIVANGVDDDGNGFVDDIHGYDFVNNDGDPIDDNEHGTHVAGTIAGVGNNGSGVVGVNWTSSVMGLKFLDAGGSGSTANAIRAVNYATLMRDQYGVNVRVTNNSWGGGGFSQALRDAINAGANAGILFVAAAGNDESNNDTSPSYPANYNVASILSVAATDHGDVLARFSNFGATTVDLAAPGVDILSTVPNNGYDEFSGTSMATPHVAGVAALAWALSPTSSITQIRDAILDGVDAVASLGGRVLTGGRLNARRTLERLGMNVTASTPAAGAAVSLPPLVFEVSFTHAFDPQTLQASDLLVNSVAASTVTIVDSDTAAFGFATSPVTIEGPQTMQMTQGAVARQSDADPLRAWQSVFYYDSVATTVLSADPLQGATLSARPSAIVLVFNEPIDPASVGVEDLQLDNGIVISATPQGTTAARYVVSQLVEDGTVRYELKAGAILDVHGNPAGAHVGGFNIDDPLVNHYRSTNVPRSINDLATVTSVITIPTSVTIADIDVGLDIRHTFDSDLDVTLISPNGTRLELFTDVGGGGANFVGTILDDEASTAIQTGGAPFAGRFRPEGPLSVLDGVETVGTWTLEIRDDAGADIGTLNAWELIISQAADIPPRIADVAPLPSDHGRTWREIEVLSIQFSEAMQPATVNAATNWELREAGADELFDTPDDVLVALATSPVYAGGLTAELTIAGGPLPPGSFRFTATGGLLDLAGNQLDGNGDRTGGDAYVRHFSVVVVPPDRFEPNNTLQQAADLGPLGSRTETNLSIHAANNDDYYLFTAAITGVLSADVFFSHAEGDLDAGLYDVNQNLLSSSVSGDDDERVLRGVMAGESYYLRIYGNGGALSPGYILQLVVSQAPPGDRFEPNDSFATARDLGGLSTRTEEDLSIHFPDNDDYFRFTPSITGTFTADVLFNHAAGDIDAELYDASQTRLNYSDSRNNDERIVWNVSAGQTYYLRVFGYAGAMNPDYTLALLISQAAVADRFEPNDNFSAASNLGSVVSRTEASLSIHAQDNDDYYRFTAGMTGVLTAEVRFSDAAGDIDVALFDDNQDFLSSSESTSDVERIAWNVTAGETYFLHVYGYQGAINPNYSVQLVVSDAPAGDRFELNDTFSQATDLGLLGSRFEDDLSIHVSDNSDYYRLRPGVSGTLSINVAFRHDDGDIDVVLYDSDESWLDDSTSTSDNERIVFQVVAGETYYLEVYGFLGETNPTYSLSVSVGVQGTPGRDVFFLRGTSDGARIEIYDAFPPSAGAVPLLIWPMNAAVPLPINTFAGDDRVLIEMPAGVHGPGAGINLDAGAGTNQLAVFGGGVRIDSVATGGDLTTTLLNGARLTTSRLMQSALILEDTSQARLLSDGATSRLTSLTIDANARLDITNNALVLDYTGDSPASAIREKIVAGRGGTGLGKAWNGPGITSSTAAQVNATAPDSRSVGYAENALLPLGVYATFRGQSVDLTSVLIAYTRTADANLDAVVNNDDVTIVGANYSPGALKPAWAFGDFEYDDSVDNDDVTLLGVFYSPQSGPPPGALVLTATSSANPTVATGDSTRRAEPGASPLPRSAWGRTFTKHSLAEVPIDVVPSWKQSFKSVRTRAELVNQEIERESRDRLIALLAASIASEGETRRGRMASRRRAIARSIIEESFWASRGE